MFYHLLQLSGRDDSNKLSNIGFGDEKKWNSDFNICALGHVKYST